MLIRCPECGEQISDQVETCPKCGMPNPAAKLASSYQERQKRRRKSALRAAGLALAVLLLIGGGTACLWVWSAHHDIVHYTIGSVRGTSEISQQQFTSLVEGVVEEWNEAADKTLLWRLPFGRQVRVSLSIDPVTQGYATTVAHLQGKSDDAMAAYQLAWSAYKYWKDTHPDAGLWEGYVELKKTDPTYDKWTAALDERMTAQTLNDTRDTHIRELKPPLDASAGPSPSLTITTYIGDADLRALVSHAVGHALGLAHSSDAYGDDAMSSQGRSTAITKDLAAEVAASH